MVKLDKKSNGECEGGTQEENDLENEQQEGKLHLPRTDIDEATERDLLVERIEEAKNNNGLGEAGKAKPSDDFELRRGTSTFQDNVVDENRPTSSHRSSLPTQRVQRMSMKKVATSKVADAYHMNHPRRGKAIIFINENFLEGLNVTPNLSIGESKYDLIMALENLDFEVTCYIDLEFKQLEGIITEVQKEDHSDADCIVIAIFTSRKDELLYAKDSDYTVSNIWNPFTADKCPSLAGKPKIFLIQTCSEPEPLAESEVSIIDKIETDVPTIECTIPRYSDFLIVNSKVSKIRATELVEIEDNGRWFVESLCDELNETGTCLDVLTIMTRVANRVTNIYENRVRIRTPLQIIQIPTIVSMLIRDVYFHPKWKLSPDTKEKADRESQPLSPIPEHESSSDMEAHLSSTTSDVEGASSFTGNTFETDGSGPSDQMILQGIVAPALNMSSVKGQQRTSTGLDAIKEPNRYNMDHPRRGRAVIFDHYRFKRNNPKKRKGTEKDRKNIKEKLTDLGFSVTCHKNLSHQEIMQEVAKVQEEDHTDADCLVVVVLTHGLENSFVNAYDVAYPLEEIWSKFKDENCPTLAGKPKLFFVQACRGTKTDTGRKVKLNTENTKQDSAGPMDFTMSSCPDIMIAYSTVEGYVSHRNVNFGSWFIVSLCKELENWGKRMDLLSLMTRVSRRVALDRDTKEQVDTEEYLGKQIPSTVSMLRGDVYFKSKEVITDDKNTNAKSCSCFG